MRTKKFHSIQKLMALFFPVLALVFSIVRPVSADDNSKSWFTVTVDPVLEKVCVGQKVWLYYTARFDGFGYCREKNCGKDGPTSSTGPGTVISSGQGRVETYDKQLETKDTSTVAFWVLERAIFIPDTAGKVSVNVNSAFFDAVATDVWQFKVTEKCEYDVEISANESGFKMPTGQTVNEAQDDWAIIVYLKGLARIIADPLVEEGGGGEKSLAADISPIRNLQENTGTVDYFGDGIWLGKQPDMTCGTNGAITCNSEFTVHPVTGEETIDFQIEMLPGQCSGFTVWCKGSDGGGQASVPPMKSLSIEMNAEIPKEGGSAHYIHQLPYGITMDYLISAYPVEEEE